MASPRSALSALESEIALRARSFVAPIDVERLCEANGLELVSEPLERQRNDAVGMPRAGLYRREDGGYRVLLRRPSNTAPRLSPLERFYVAHEVAHALIDRRTAWSPSDQREYFEREDWCNRLAAIILVPPLAVQGERTSLENVLASGSALSRLATACGVPREAAAIGAQCAGVQKVFFGLQHTRRKNGEPVWRTLWVSTPTPELGLTKSKMHDRDEPLSLLAYEASRARGYSVAVCLIEYPAAIGMLALPGPTQRVLCWMDALPARPVRANLQAGELDRVRA